MKTLPIVIAICGFSASAFAQFQGQVYFRNEGVRAFAYSQEQTMGWCGGFDNPQPALADLNHDGKNDLIMYERDTKQLKTFINYGSPGNPDYRYKPEYAANFPVVDEYLKMEDYNRDTIPDLFHRGLYGVDVYKGYYNGSNELCFTHYKGLFYHNDAQSTGEVNVYVEPSDIPAMVDMDHDGDLDMVAYWSGGSKLYYYKNYQVEKGLPKDSIYINLADHCWGKLDQVFKRAHNLDMSCDNSSLADLRPSGQNRHTGNCLCLFDHDGDGDYDYMDGNVSYSDIQFLKNGKLENSHPADSMVLQDTLWQSNGRKLQLAQWPAAFWLDIDQDGDKDMVFSAHASGTENVKCISYYKNTGSDAGPVFTFQSDSFIMDKIIDAGTGSFPMFYDYNRDGRPDLIVGSDGFYQSNGTLKSKLLYYKNNSTLFNASFELQDANFNSIFGENLAGAAPATGDLNNDGKDDLVLGQSDGSVAYYPNTAASPTAQPNWLHSANTQMKLRDSANNIITVSENAAPFIYDLNKDGKPDLIIGGKYLGYLAYYENISTVTGQIKLALRNSQVGNVLPDPLSFINCSTPFIGKMDNTGSDYILSGSYSGAIYRYDGFQTGNTSITYPAIDTMYSFINDGLRSAPAVADIDGDGKYEMVVGNLKGGLTLYSQNQAADINTSRLTAGNTKDVRVYPNPAKDMLYFSWSRDFAAGDVQITIYAITGQRVIQAQADGSWQTAMLPLRGLAAGTYYCELRSGDNRSVSAVTISK